MCSITDKLRTIIDPNNPQDQKTLLLAQLVSSKVSDIKDVQEDHSILLKETHDMVENLIEKVNANINLTKECPVFKEREKYETVTFFLKNTKIALLTMLGILTMALLQLKDYIIDIINFVNGANH